jgi:hypothetical protein
MKYSAAMICAILYHGFNDHVPQDGYILFARSSGEKFLKQHLSEEEEEEDHGFCEE